MNSSELFIEANNYCTGSSINSRISTPEEILEQNIKEMEQHLKNNNITYQCPLCKSMEYQIVVHSILGSQLVCKKCKYVMHFNAVFR